MRDILGVRSIRGRRKSQTGFFDPMLLIYSATSMRLCPLWRYLESWDPMQFYFRAKILFCVQKWLFWRSNKGQIFIILVTPRATSFVRTVFLAILRPIQIFVVLTCGG